MYQPSNRWDYTVGYSDDDVFWKMIGFHGYIDVNHNSKGTFVKHIFQNFELFLANSVLKFQESSTLT